jgi:hypothetical protein
MSWFVTSNKGRKEITFPDSWAKVTTHQFQRLATEWDSSDLVQLFSILSGIEYKALRDTHDYILEEQLLNATKFVYNEPMAFKEAKLPHWVTINSRQCRIPAHIGTLSIGQSIHVRQALDKAKAWEELISFVVAIYIQPAFDESDFDYHRAVELKADIEKLPITETYPLAFFLLKPILKYGGNTLSRLNLLILRLQNLSTRKDSV